MLPRNILSRPHIDRASTSYLSAQSLEPGPDFGGEFDMTTRRTGLVLAFAISLACRRTEAVPESLRVSAADVTPTLSPPATSDGLGVEPTWTPEPLPLSPSPAHRDAALDVPGRATVTPVDIGSIPNFDRPRDPTPSSRVEELSRCLSYRAAPDPTYSSTSRVRLLVRARNTCAAWIPIEETKFEVLSKPAMGGGTIARAVGQFQAAIPPGSSHLETVIEIDCPAAGGCRYDVSVSGP